MSFMYNGIEHGSNNMFIKYRYIPLNTCISTTFPNGTPKNTESIIEVKPPTGYKIAITYFELTTPEETQANILAKSLDKTEMVLLAKNQLEGISNQKYYAKDWDIDFVILNSFKLYSVVSATITTANRTTILCYGGGYAKVF